MDDAKPGPHVPPAPSDRWSDRYAIWCVWGVWAVLLVAAVGYIRRYSYDIPFMDEWLLVDVLTGHQPIDLAWLWSQHNQHRIPLPRLVYLGLSYLTQNDFRAGMYFNLAALAGLASVMILAARRMRGWTSYADTFFPLALLHTGHCENLLWGFQVEFVLSTLLASGLLLVVLCAGGAPTVRAVWAAGICLLGLPLTGAHGLPFVPPLALWLVVWGWRHRRTPELAGARIFFLTAAIAAASLALVAVYFVGYHSVELHPPSRSPQTTLTVTLRILGMSVGPGMITYWKYVRVAGVVLLLASFAALIWRGLRSPRERVRCLGFLAFLSAVVGLAVAIGWGRGGMGIHLGFTFRYVTLAVPLICCLYFAAGVCGPGRWGRLAQLGLCVVLALLVTENRKYGKAYARQRRPHYEAVQRDLQAHVSPAEFGQKNTYLFPLPGPLAEWAEKLRRAGVGQFTSLAPSSAQQGTDYVESSARLSAGSSHR